MNDRFSFVFTLLRRLEHWLIDPPAEPLSVEQGQRQRLISALMLLHVALIGLFLILQPLLHSSSDEISVSAFGLVITLVLYAAARTRYYNRAAVVLIGVWYIVGFIVEIVYRPNFSVQPFLVIPVFIISLLFSLNSTVLAVIILLLTQVLLGPLTAGRFNAATPLLFTTGVSAFIVFTTSQRQHDTERLRLSEARYRNLMDASGEALMIQTLKGVILDVNPGFERLMGYTREETVGQRAVDWLHPPARELLLAHRDTSSDTPVQVEARHKDGTIRILEVAIRPHTYQGQPAYVVIAHDVTHRQEAERERLEHEQRYQALFNNTADAVFIIKLDGIILSANQRALEMLRASREDVEGQNYENYMQPEEARRSRTTMNRVISGDAQPIFQRRFRRKDGTQFIGEVNMMLVRDSHKNPLYLQSVVRDTTERRKMEEREFELALQRERMKILQKFIDDASHYFRTPLTNLKTSAYLLSRFAHVPDKQREHLGVMKIQIERMEQLLDDLLMVARLDKEAGDETRNTAIDINRLILQLLPGYFGDNQTATVHQWEFLPSSEPAEVFGDRNRLSVAISNVITNARTYTPEGGTITIRTYLQHRMVVIEVQDTGIGIEAEDLAHIFDNFYRADAARVIDSTGSGMGLSIALKIVEMHRGVMRVASEPGKGSTFQLVLPLAGDWTTVTQEMAATLSQPAQP